MNKEETDLIIAEQNKSTEEILKAVAKVKADYHELCKLKDMRIAELEEEVKEWKDKADLWCKTANLKDHNIMINKELEKENTRLKNINSHTLSQLNLDNGELIIENEQLRKENTKAKELLKRCYENYIYLEPLRSEIEQFLNENSISEHIQKAKYNYTD